MVVNANLAPKWTEPADKIPMMRTPKTRRTELSALREPCSGEDFRRPIRAMNLWDWRLYHSQEFSLNLGRVLLWAGSSPSTYKHSELLP